MATESDNPSRAALHSLLWGSFTWAAIIGGVLMAAMPLIFSPESGVAKGVARVFFGFFFLAVLAFSNGLRLGVRGLAASDKIVALLGLAINGLGVLCWIGWVLVILTD